MNFVLFFYYILFLFILFYSLLFTLSPIYPHITLPASYSSLGRAVDISIMYYNIHIPRPPSKEVAQEMCSQFFMLAISDHCHGHLWAANFFFVTKCFHAGSCSNALGISGPLSPLAPLANWQRSLFYAAFCEANLSQDTSRLEHGEEHTVLGGRGRVEGGGLAFHYTDNLLHIMAQVAAASSTSSSSSLHVVASVVNKFVR